jgi:hypothetical protein
MKLSPKEVWAFENIISEDPGLRELDRDYPSDDGLPTFHERHAVLMNGLKGFLVCCAAACAVACGYILIIRAVSSISRLGQTGM